MAKILVDRDVLEQALEALEYGKALLNWKDSTTTMWFAHEITALKAELAQEQAEPVCERVMTITTVPITVPRVLTDADLDAIRMILLEGESNGKDFS